ncbi:hypothetical protein DV738_g2766, partial [Chaetothyriales sp. CBS 135597]
MSQEKASLLAGEALALFRDGRKEEASRKLREAAALSHDNPHVQAAFLEIHNEENRSHLLELCRRYTLYHDEKAGEDAVKYLKSAEAFNAASTAVECLQLILDCPQSTLSASQDAIIALLASHSSQVRLYFARELETRTTEFFDNIYDRGDEAANCLRNIVLNPSLWPNETTRQHVEDELFQLFLAKLMETGHDHDGRALKGIALLLIADPFRLHQFVDEDGYDALLTSLDYRLPPDVRGEATLVLSKFLEVAEEVGNQNYARFINSRLAKKKADDLIVAFSAGACLFPITPVTSAQLLLKEGFLTSMVALLDKNSGTVQDSFLALLNAACIDGACRSAISKTCGPWLSHKVSNGRGKQASTAANILAKLRTSGAKPVDQKAGKTDDDVSELVDLFTRTLAVEEERHMSDCIEGLAYTSLKPEVKERLAKDQTFLKRLLEAIETNMNVPEIAVGGLSIVSNLTHFQPTLSEEQKRISQLKAYANASKPVEINPLEKDEQVQGRCTALVDAGVVSTLVKLNKTGSGAQSQLTDQILASLARNKSDRGKLAQQGAVRLLVQHAQKAGQAQAASNTASSKSPKPAWKTTTTPDQHAAHALAKILISLNPSHVFPASGTPHISDAVPPLVLLLQPPDEGPFSDQPRDLLPVFESLLALTNLASSPDPSAASTIIRLGWDKVEDLMLNDNVMLRRAATELICNLSALPLGAAKFADGTQRAKQRLRILVAMADVDDIKTRLAAGGALAMLSQHDGVVPAILDEPRGVEIVLDLVGGEDEALAHRGLVVLQSLVSGNGENGRRGREAVRKQGGADKVQKALTKTKGGEVFQVGIKVLKALKEDGGKK